MRSRLVNPTRASVNSEDVFVLVTPTELYEYIGAKANVIEKAKVRTGVLENICPFLNWVDIIIGHHFVLHEF